MINNNSFCNLNIMPKPLKMPFKSLKSQFLKTAAVRTQKRLERAGVRLHLTLPLALRGKGCFQYTVSILYPLQIALKAVFSILNGIPYFQIVV
jgi:hypothetical protein